MTIDGTYIRANSSAFGRQHYVVAGRIERDGQMSGRFAWVTQNPPDPSRFMKAVLEDHGCAADTKVAVLADGADGLPGVVHASSPQPPRRILDWFHLSMRLRPIEQTGAKLSRQIAESHPIVAAILRDKLPRVRHQFWNGKFADAVNRMFMIRTSIVDIAAQLPRAESERAERMRVHLIDMREYLKNNCGSLTNYSAARRNGLRISSAPAESSMSNVINQRMGKRQPMSSVRRRRTPLVASPVHRAGQPARDAIPAVAHEVSLLTSRRGATRFVTARPQGRSSSTATNERNSQEELSACANLEVGGASFMESRPRSQSQPAWPRTILHWRLRSRAFASNRLRPTSSGRTKSVRRSKRAMSRSCKTWCSARHSRRMIHSMTLLPRRRLTIEQVDSKIKRYTRSARPVSLR